MSDSLSHAVDESSRDEMQKRPLITSTKKESKHQKSSTKVTFLDFLVLFADIVKQAKEHRECRARAGPRDESGGPTLSRETERLPGLSTGTHSSVGRRPPAVVDESADMGHRTLLLILCGLTLATVKLVTAQNVTGTNPAAIKVNERFRRLIPYMTFYFAQQNYGNRPQYQEVAPVTSNKLSAVPQYQGNLVVPTTYLLRYTSRPALAPRPFSPSNRYPDSPTAQAYQAQPVKELPTAQAYQAQPVKESPTAQTYQPPQNYKIQQIKELPPAQIYQPTHTYQTHPIKDLPPVQAYQQSQTYQTQPIKDYTGQQPTPQIKYDTDRATTIMQILNILQAIRRLPTTVTPNNREQTTAQLVDILRQTSQLPTSTVASLAKILSRLPQYKAYQSVDTPISSSPNPIYTNANPTIIRIYPKNYVGKVVQVSTPVPNQVTSLDYEAYDDPSPPEPTPKILVSPLTPIPKPALPQVSTLAPVPSLAQNVNDLQNYDYSSEVIDTPESKPSTKGKLASKKPQAVTDSVDGVQTYGYATKQPQSNYYHGQTTTQIFPDPTTEGGTPGRPGIDYPTYSRIPETSFTCKNQRYKGFFGDPETSCQVWHYCDLNGGQASFLCPNGTMFSQVGLTCDWWFNVKCSSTPQLYVLNERLYKYILPVAPSFPEDFAGPLVDQYLTLKFNELENKKNAKNSNKTETATPSKEQ
ncbi:uncharacterized protein [Periplaneta americana]|uniref:uncharacterized protein n=1 Tax=Periplaneta americana TaxID=6978 RepID=UPI0037E80D9F